MLFNSYSFIVFLAIVLVLHYMPFPWKAKKVNLLLASYLFYAVWNPPFIILLWLSTLVDFFIGKRLYAEENRKRRKILLVVSLVANLGMLGFFKYGGFLLENFVVLMSALGIEYNPPAPDIILPVGISFYSFQTLSYTLDMYRKKKSAGKFLTRFLSFCDFLPTIGSRPNCTPR